MRIVAGKYGSRSLKSPKNDATRPTQDKIKGAIFSSLGNIFDGGNFLDCYKNNSVKILKFLKITANQQFDLTIRLL